MNGGKEDSFGLWDGERVFQEARRLLIAQWQHLIYQEWLPILLGQTFVRKYDLLPATRGYTTNYDPSIDPRINNEFSTAAFRLEVTLSHDNIFRIFLFHQIWAQHGGAARCCRGQQLQQCDRLQPGGRLLQFLRLQR